MQFLKLQLELKAMPHAFKRGSLLLVQDVKTLSPSLDVRRLLFVCSPELGGLGSEEELQA